MEHLPGEGKGFSPAVHLITQKRMTDVGHVHPNLVGTPGFQLDPHMGVRAKALEHAVMADRRFAPLHHRHALTLPLFTSLTHEEQDYIVKTLGEALA